VFTLANPRINRKTHREKAKNVNQ